MHYDFNPRILTGAWKFADGKDLLEKPIVVHLTFHLFLQVISIYFILPFPHT